VVAPAGQKKEGSLWFGREPGDQGTAAPSEKKMKTLGLRVFCV